MKHNFDYLEMNSFDSTEQFNSKKKPISTPKRIDESKEKNKKVDYKVQRQLKRGE